MESLIALQAYTRDGPAVCGKSIEPGYGGSSVHDPLSSTPSGMGLSRVGGRVAGTSMREPQTRCCDAGRTGVGLCEVVEVRLIMSLPGHCSDLQRLYTHPSSYLQ